MQVGILFRFLQLNKMQAITMSREIKGATYDAKEGTEFFIGSVPLFEENFDDINLFFIRQKIAIEDCDVLISSNTLDGKSELAVPVMVNKFLKDIDCKLTVSLEK